MSIFLHQDMAPDFLFTILDHQTAGSQDSIHWHNYLQIGLCFEGTGKFIMTNKEYPVEEGDIIIVSNFEHHVAIAEPNEKTRYLFVIFMPDFIAAPGCSQLDFEYLYPFLYDARTFNNKIEKRLPEAKKISQIIQNMKAIWDTKAEGYRHELDAALRTILAILIKYYKSSYPDYYSADAQSHAKMQSILQYINGNFTSNITIEGITRRFHISESTFRNHFREILHIGYKEYVTYLRLTEARKLLLTTEQSINEIANTSGYSNINQFYKIFHKYVFMSPADYRKKFSAKR